MQRYAPSGTGQAQYVDIFPHVAACYMLHVVTVVVHGTQGEVLSFGVAVSCSADVARGTLTATQASATSTEWVTTSTSTSA